MIFSNIIARFASNLPSVRALQRSISTRNITFVSGRKMRRIAQAIYLIRIEGVRGRFIEAGVALGGTAVLIGRLKPKNAPLDLFDVFSMIPPPSEKDSADAKERYAQIMQGQATGLGEDVYYGYRSDLKEVVRRNLESFGLNLDENQISLLEGLFEETLQISDAVAFAHVDCDWHDPVSLCIERIWPKLSVGGIMLFDDYKSYEGCRLAVDSFVEGRSDCQVLHRDSSIALRKVLV